MKRRVPHAFQRDAQGKRVRVGDTVAFFIDPDKPSDTASVGKLVRWVNRAVAEVEYTGFAYDGAKPDGSPKTHRFELRRDEFWHMTSGAIAHRAMNQMHDTSTRAAFRRARAR